MIDTNKFKEFLETQLKDITVELSTVGVHVEETDDWVATPDPKGDNPDADENTNADLVESWNEKRATLSDLEIEYRDIKRALQKIESGTYGVCEISGEPIEEKRLEARPDARTCIAHMNEESTLQL